MLWLLPFDDMQYAMHANSLLSQQTITMFFQFAIIALMLVQAAAFAPRALRTGRVQVSRQFADKITITEGVDFDTIAREWRLKWSPDDDKKSLAAVQQALLVFLPAIKKIDGVKSVQRIVCGGCLDYKVREESCDGGCS